MKFISIVLVAGLFLGCTVEKNHEPKKNNVLNLKKEAQIEDVVVEDLINIPQDIAYYTKAIETKKLYDVQKNMKSLILVYGILQNQHKVLKIHSGLLNTFMLLKVTVKI